MGIATRIGVKGAALQIIFVAALVISPVAAQAQDEADLVLFNGKVITADEAFTVAEGLAVKNGRVLKTGTSAQVLSLAGLKTIRVDLKGKSAIPGLIDTHVHLFDYALGRWRKELAKTEPLMNEFKPTRIKVASVEEAVTRIEEIVKGAGKGRWVQVQVSPRKLAQKFFDSVTLEQLDRISPMNPLVVRLAGTQRADNSLVLKALRERYGNLPSDLVKNGKVGYRHGAGVARLITADVLIKRWQNLAPVYKKELELWASLGITTWSSSLVALSSQKAYRLLDRKNEMPIRFAYSHSMGKTAFPQGPGFYERLGDVAGFGSDYLWDIGVSLSALDSSYPRMCASIKASPKIKRREKCRGRPGMFLREVMFAAVKAGLRITGTHVYGDLAADDFMDAIEEGSKAGELSEDEIRSRRHAIDHCALNPRPDQIERAKRLGIIWSCAPRYITRAPRAAKDYGERYADKWVVPIKSILSAGGKVVMESDDRRLPKKGVMQVLELAVTRKDKSGKVLSPQERVDRKTALLMYTRWAAEYVLREDVLGSLEPGKWADVVVLSGDYLKVEENDIGKLRPLMTVVGGKLVYTDPEFARAEKLPQVGYRKP